MSHNSQNLHFWWKVSSFLLLVLQSVALNSDGILLLKFKYSILSDPLSVLDSWNYDDATPCSWHGVTCTETGSPGTGTPDLFRVTSLVLPNNQLLGSIAEELGMIQYLRHLDLSNNFLNGSLPNSIFNSSHLQVLSLSNNVISGQLPELIGKLTSLQFLNLSDNAFAGLIPENLTALQNLTVVSLKSNYFSGEVPTGFNSVEILDLSSNLLNGSLPNHFGGESLRYLNLSYNKISGTIPPAFAKQIPGNSTIDLSFNNLTGPIPESLALLNQKTELLSGNADLCGKPLKILCSIPSTISTPPPNITNTSSPAIAAIPKTIDTNPTTNTTENPSQNVSQNGLKPATIAAIVVGDLAGMAVLALIILFVYQQRKRRDPKPATATTTTNSEKKQQIVARQDPEVRTTSLPFSCLKIKEEETSEATSSDSDHDNNTNMDITAQNENLPKEGTLVTVDGETKLELDTLLKASAYILGTSRKGGSSPVNLSLEVRLKIAKGVARGLAFIHEKKHVHGNIKPSNILLNSEMEPIISDFGLDRLLLNDSINQRANGSARQLMVNQRTQQEPPIGSVSSPYATMGPSSSGGQGQVPYQAPESLQNIKPSPKWDVYSFGIVLLELLSGRVFSDRELDQWSEVSGSVEEEKNRILRLADVAIKAEIKSRENVILGCFKLGLSCASLVPQKRPSMKEALQILDKIPASAIN
ncbi:Protein kinase domain [Sesbania bispinosa]|nr:Protein kinase domain [Sesbania bispinosa]